MSTYRYPECQKCGYVIDGYGCLNEHCIYHKEDNSNDKDYLSKYFVENLIEPHPMLMLTGGRGTGKTWRMFEYAQEHGYAIFTTSEVRKKSLKDYSERLGFNVKVISPKDITGEEKMHVCVDELQSMISEIEDEYNIIIEMCTLLACPTPHTLKGVNYGRNDYTISHNGINSNSN